MPILRVVFLSFVIGMILAPGMSFDALSSMLDFIATIAPVLFTAFGIWIGIIDPKCIFSNADSHEKETDEIENLGYRLCYFLMWCTLVLVSTITLKALFITYVSWQRFLIYINWDIVPFLKTIATMMITALYLIELWVAIAVVLPQHLTMKKHEQNAKDDNILGVLPDEIKNRD
jgi:uncharacterized membrane protein